MDRNTIFDKSDFYKVLSMYQSSTIFGLLARYSKKGTGYNFCDTILPYRNID